MCFNYYLINFIATDLLDGFFVGFVIVVDQLIPELGLADLAEAHGGVSHGSSVDKLRFLFENIQHSSQITATVAGVSFVIIMVFR